MKKESWLSKGCVDEGRMNTPTRKDEEKKQEEKQDVGKFNLIHNCA